MLSTDRIIEVTVRELILAIIVLLETIIILVLLVMHVRMEAQEANIQEILIWRSAYETSMRRELILHRKLGRTCTGTVDQLVSTLGLKSNLDLTTYGSIYGVGGPSEDSDTDKTTDN